MTQSFRRRAVIRAARLPFRKLTAAATAVVFLSTSLLSPVAEANFWQDRQAAARQQPKTDSTGARRPGDAALLAQLPSLQRSVLSQSVPVFQDNPASGVPDSALAGTSARTAGGTPNLPAWVRDVPFQHAALKELHLPAGWKPGDLLVLHIQDAHENLDAQRNIARVVETMATRSNGSPILVGIEGAGGGFNFRPYRTFPDAAITRELADYFLTERFITGPEFAGMTLGLPETGAGSPEPPLTFHGVEEESLYLRHVEALKNSVKLQTEARGVHARLRDALERIKGQKLNPDLRALDDRVTRHHEGRLGLGDYVKFLDAKGAAGGSVRLFLDALALEESLDFQRVEAERLSLTRALGEKLPPRDLRDLVQAGLSYRAGTLPHGDFYRHLKGLCGANGLKLERWPEMDRYIRYVLASDRIEPGKLFDDVRALERGALRAGAKTPEESRLVELSEELGLIGKMIDYRLTPDEWEDYRSRREDIRRFADNLRAAGADFSLPDRALPVPDLLAAFEGFNEAAIARNEAMVENLLKKAAGGAWPVALLVAGGFHTDGMMEILRSKRIAYAVLTPRLGKVEGPGTGYLDVFTRDKTPLEKLFTGDRITLASRPATARDTMGGALPSGAATLEGQQIGLGTIRLIVKSLKAIKVDERFAEAPFRRAVTEQIVRYMKDAGFLTLESVEIPSVEILKLKDGSVSDLRIAMTLHPLGETAENPPRLVFTVGIDGTVTFEKGSGTQAVAKFRDMTIGIGPGKTGAWERIKSAAHRTAELVKTETEAFMLLPIVLFQDWREEAQVWLTSLGGTVFLYLLSKLFDKVFLSKFEKRKKAGLDHPSYRPFLSENMRTSQRENALYFLSKAFRFVLVLFGVNFLGNLIAVEYQTVLSPLGAVPDVVLWLAGVPFLSTLLMIAPTVIFLVALKDLKRRLPDVINAGSFLGPMLAVGISIFSVQWIPYDFNAVLILVLWVVLGGLSLQSLFEREKPTDNLFIQVLLEEISFRGRVFPLQVVSLINLLLSQGTAWSFPALPYLAGFGLALAFQAVVFAILHAQNMQRNFLGAMKDYMRFTFLVSFLVLAPVLILSPFGFSPTFGLAMGLCLSTIHHYRDNVRILKYLEALSSLRSTLLSWAGLFPGDLHERKLTREQDAGLFANGLFAAGLFFTGMGLDGLGHRLQGWWVSASLIGRKVHREGEVVKLMPGSRLSERETLVLLEHMGRLSSRSGMSLEMAGGRYHILGPLELKDKATFKLLPASSYFVAHEVRNGQAQVVLLEAAKAFLDDSHFSLALNDESAHPVVIQDRAAGIIAWRVSPVALRSYFDIRENGILDFESASDTWPGLLKPLAKAPLPASQPNRQFALTIKREDLEKALSTGTEFGNFAYKEIIPVEDSLQDAIKSAEALYPKRNPFKPTDSLDSLVTVIIDQDALRRNHNNPWAVVFPPSSLPYLTTPLFLADLTDESKKNIRDRFQLKEVDPRWIRLFGDDRKSSARQARLLALYEFIRDRAAEMAQSVRNALKGLGDVLRRRLGPPTLGVRQKAAYAAYLALLAVLVLPTLAYADAGLGLYGASALGAGLPAFLALGFGIPLLVKAAGSLAGAAPEKSFPLTGFGEQVRFLVDLADRVEKEKVRPIREIVLMDDGPERAQRLEELGMHEKGEKGPVTLADKRAQFEMVKQVFAQHPDAYIVCEEDFVYDDPLDTDGSLKKEMERYRDMNDRNSASGSAARFWLNRFWFDPIDGTREFLHRDSNFYSLSLFGDTPNGKVAVIKAPELEIRMKDGRVVKGATFIADDTGAYVRYGEEDAVHRVRIDPKRVKKLKTKGKLVVHNDTGSLSPFEETVLRGGDEKTSVLFKVGSVALIPAVMGLMLSDLDGMGVAQVVARRRDGTPVVDETGYVCDITKPSNPFDTLGPHFWAQQAGLVSRGIPKRPGSGTFGPVFVGTKDMWDAVKEAFPRFNRSSSSRPLDSLPVKTNGHWRPLVETIGTAAVRRRASEILGMHSGPVMRKLTETLLSESNDPRISAKRGLIRQMASDMGAALGDALFTLAYERKQRDFVRALKSIGSDMTASEMAALSQAIVAHGKIKIVGGLLTGAGTKEIGKLVIDAANARLAARYRKMREEIGLVPEKPISLELSPFGEFGDLLGLALSLAGRLDALRGLFGTDATIEVPLLDVGRGYIKAGSAGIDLKTGKLLYVKALANRETKTGSNGTESIVEMVLPRSGGESSPEGEDLVRQLIRQFHEDELVWKGMTQDALFVVSNIYGDLNNADFYRGLLPSTEARGIVDVLPSALAESRIHPDRLSITVRGEITAAVPRSGTRDSLMDTDEDFELRNESGESVWKGRVHSIPTNSPKMSLLGPLFAGVAAVIEQGLLTGGLDILLGGRAMAVLGKTLFPRDTGLQDRIKLYRELNRGARTKTDWAFWVGGVAGGAMVILWTVLAFSGGWAFAWTPFMAALLAIGAALVGMYFGREHRYEDLAGYGLKEQRIVGLVGAALTAVTAAVAVLANATWQWNLPLSLLAGVLAGVILHGIYNNAVAPAFRLPAADLIPQTSPRQHAAPIGLPPPLLRPLESTRYIPVLTHKDIAALERLNPVEMRLAELLSLGLSLSEAAGALRMSLTLARTYQDALYAALKCGTIDELSEKVLGYKRFGKIDSLIEQEARVARMAGDGYPDHQIATRLNVPMREIQRHVSSVIHKLALRDRKELEELMTRFQRLDPSSAFGKLTDREWDFILHVGERVYHPRQAAKFFRVDEEILEDLRKSVLKKLGVSTLREADRLARRHMAFHPGADKRVPRIDDLEERHASVLELVLRGFDDGRIAQSLRIPLPEAAARVQYLKERVGVEDREDLAVLAARRKFLPESTPRTVKAAGTTESRIAEMAMRGISFDKIKTAPDLSGEIKAGLDKEKVRAMVLDHIAGRTLLWRQAISRDEAGRTYTYDEIARLIDLPAHPALPEFPRLLVALAVPEVNRRLEEAGLPALPLAEIEFDLPAGLLPSEAEVLKLMVLGAHNKEIAAIRMSEAGTVRIQISNILKKTGYPGAGSHLISDVLFAAQRHIPVLTLDELMAYKRLKPKKFSLMKLASLGIKSKEMSVMDRTSDGSLRQTFTWFAKRWGVMRRRDLIAHMVKLNRFLVVSLLPTDLRKALDAVPNVFQSHTEFLIREMAKNLKIDETEARRLATILLEMLSLSRVEELGPFMRTYRALDPAYREVSETARRIAGLDEFQLRLLDMMFRGLSDKEIATVLQVPEEKIEGIVQGIHKRAGTSNREELMGHMAEYKLLPARARELLRSPFPGTPPTVAPMNSVSASPRGALISGIKLKWMGAALKRFPMLEKRSKLHNFLYDVLIAPLLTEGVLYSHAAPPGMRHAWILSDPLLKLLGFTAAAVASDAFGAPAGALVIALTWGGLGALHVLAHKEDSRGPPAALALINTIVAVSYFILFPHTPQLFLTVYSYNMIAHTAVNLFFRVFGTPLRHPLMRRFLADWFTDSLRANLPANILGFFAEQLFPGSGLYVLVGWRFVYAFAVMRLKEEGTAAVGKAVVNAVLSALYLFVYAGSIRDLPPFETVMSAVALTSYNAAYSIVPSYFKFIALDQTTTRYKKAWILRAGGEWERPARDGAKNPLERLITDNMGFFEGTIGQSEKAFKDFMESTNLAQRDWAETTAKLRKMIAKKRETRDKLLKAGVDAEQGGGIVLTVRPEIADQLAMLLALELSGETPFPVFIVGSTDPEDFEDALRLATADRIVTDAASLRLENRVYVVSDRKLFHAGSVVSAENGFLSTAHPLAVKKDSLWTFPKGPAESVRPSLLDLGLEQSGAAAELRLGDVEHVAVNDGMPATALVDAVSRVSHLRSIRRGVGLLLDGQLTDPSFVDKYLKTWDDGGPSPLYLLVADNARNRELFADFRNVVYFDGRVPPYKARLKLSWLLGRNVPADKVQAAMDMDLAGEIPDAATPAADPASLETPPATNRREVLKIWPGMGSEVIREAVNRLIAVNGGEEKTLLLYGYGRNAVPLGRKGIEAALFDWLEEEYPELSHNVRTKFSKLRAGGTPGTVVELFEKALETELRALGESWEKAARRVLRRIAARYDGPPLHNEQSRYARRMTKDALMESYPYLRELGRAVDSGVKVELRGQAPGMESDLGSGEIGSALRAVGVGSQRSAGETPTGLFLRKPLNVWLYRQLKAKRLREVLIRHEKFPDKEIKVHLESPETLDGQDVVVARNIRNTDDYIQLLWTLGALRQEKSKAKSIRLGVTFSDEFLGPVREDEDYARALFMMLDTLAAFTPQVKVVDRNGGGHDIAEWAKLEGLKYDPLEIDDPYAPSGALPSEKIPKADFIISSTHDPGDFAHEMAGRLGVPHYNWDCGRRDIARDEAWYIDRLPRNMPPAIDLRGKTVYLVLRENPDSNNGVLRSVLLMAALKRAGANVVPIIPFLRYARQDMVEKEGNDKPGKEKYRPGEAGSLEIRLRLMQAMGMVPVLFHAHFANPLEVSQKYKSKYLPVGLEKVTLFNINMIPHLVKNIWGGLKQAGIKLSDIVLIGPDQGIAPAIRDAARGSLYGEERSFDVVTFDKDRTEGNARILGVHDGTEDYRNKVALIIDDLTTSGGPIKDSADYILGIRKDENGRKIHVWRGRLYHFLKLVRAPRFVFQLLNFVFPRLNLPYLIIGATVHGPYAKEVQNTFKGSLVDFRDIWVSETLDTVKMNAIPAKNRVSLVGPFLEFLRAHGAAPDETPRPEPKPAGPPQSSVPDKAPSWKPLAKKLLLVLLGTKLIYVFKTKIPLPILDRLLRNEELLTDIHVILYDLTFDEKMRIFTNIERTRMRGLSIELIHLFLGHDVLGANRWKLSESVPGRASMESRPLLGAKFKMFSLTEMIGGDKSEKEWLYAFLGLNGENEREFFAHQSFMMRNWYGTVDGMTVQYRLKNHPLPPLKMTRGGPEDGSSFYFQADPNAESHLFTIRFSDASGDPVLRDTRAPFYIKGGAVVINLAYLEQFSRENRRAMLLAILGSAHEKIYASGDFIAENLIAHQDALTIVQGGFGYGFNGFMAITSDRAGLLRSIRDNIDPDCWFARALDQAEKIDGMLAEVKRSMPGILKSSGSDPLAISDKLLEIVYKPEHTDMDIPLFREVDPPHSKNTWEWLMRLYPEAPLAAQLAARWHDIDRAYLHTYLDILELRERIGPGLIPDDVKYFYHPRISAQVFDWILESAGVAGDIIDGDVIRHAKALIVNHELGDTEHLDTYDRRINPNIGKEVSMLQLADSLSFFSRELILINYRHYGWKPSFRNEISNKWNRLGRDPAVQNLIRQVLVENLRDTAESGTPKDIADMNAICDIFEKTTGTTLERPMNDQSTVPLRAMGALGFWANTNFRDKGWIIGLAEGPVFFGLGFLISALVMAHAPPVSLSEFIWMLGWPSLAMAFISHAVLGVTLSDGSLSRISFTSRSDFGTSLKHLLRATLIAGGSAALGVGLTAYLGLGLGLPMGIALAAGIVLAMAFHATPNSRLIKNAIQIAFDFLPYFVTRSITALYGPTTPTVTNGAPDIMKQLQARKKQKVIFAYTANTDESYVANGRRLNTLRLEPKQWTQHFFHQFIRQLHDVDFEDMEELLRSLRKKDGKPYTEILSGKRTSVCLSATEYNLKLVLSVAEEVKKANPKTIVIVGGPITSSFHPAHLAQHPAIDIACSGLGEYTLPLVLKSLKPKDPDPLSPGNVQTILDQRVTRKTRAGIETVRMGDGAGLVSVAIKDSNGWIHASGRKEDLTKEVWFQGDKYAFNKVPLFTETDLAAMNIRFAGNPSHNAVKFYPATTGEWDQIFCLPESPGEMLFIDFEDQCRHGAKCTFCSVPQLGANRPSIDRIIELVEEAQRKGVKKIFFSADDLWVEQGWFRELCDKIAEKGLNRTMSFWGHTRILKPRELEEFITASVKANFNFANGIGLDGFSVPWVVSVGKAGVARGDRSAEEYLKDARTLAEKMMEIKKPVQYNLIGLPLEISLADLTQGYVELSRFILDLWEKYHRTITPTFSAYLYPTSGSPIHEKYTWRGGPTQVIFTQAEIDALEIYETVDETGRRPDSTVQRRLHHFNSMWGELVPLRELTDTDGRKLYLCAFRPLYFDMDRDLRQLRDKVSVRYAKDAAQRRDMGLIRAMMESILEIADDAAVQQKAHEVIRTLDQLDKSFAETEQQSRSKINLALQKLWSSPIQVEVSVKLPREDIYRDYGLEIHRWMIPSRIIQGLERQIESSSHPSKAELHRLLSETLSYFDQGKFIPNDSVRARILDETERLLGQIEQIARASHPSDRKKSAKTQRVGDGAQPNSLLYLLTGNPVLGMIGMMMESAVALSLAAWINGAAGPLGVLVIGPLSFAFAPLAAAVLALLVYSWIHARVEAKHRPDLARGQPQTARTWSYFKGFLPYLPAALFAANPLGFTIFALTAFLSHFIGDRLFFQRDQLRGTVTLSRFNRDPKRELKILKDLRRRLLLERESPGAGELPLIVALSDIHGQIESYDRLILDAVRKISVPGARPIPADFKPAPDRTLAENLAPFGVRLEDLKGKLFFYVNGDLCDKGASPYKVILRTAELAEAGLCDFVDGNHDMLLFIPLLGLSLPTYDAFFLLRDFAGHEELIARIKAKNAALGPDEARRVWLARLSLFLDDQNGEWAKAWESFDAERSLLLSDLTRGLGTDDAREVNRNVRQFKPFRKLLMGIGNQHHSLAWWTGVRDGLISLRADPGRDAGILSDELLERCVDLSNRVIRALHQRQEGKKAAGLWWYEFFAESDNGHESSVLYKSMSWFKAKGFASSLWKELGVGLEEGFDDPRVKKAVDFYRAHFNLYHRDLYQNTYLHMLLPLDESTGEFFFRYDKREYRGAGADGYHGSVWEGMDIITRAIRDPETPRAELLSALTLVNSWYEFMRDPFRVAMLFDPEQMDRIYRANGLKRLNVGHVPLHLYAMILSSRDRRALAGFHVSSKLLISDHGMAEDKPGAAIHYDAEGIHLRGEDGVGDLVAAPPTVHKGEVLFENAGVGREEFLAQVLRDTEERIAELNKMRSGLRAALARSAKALVRTFRTLRSALPMLLAAAVLFPLVSLPAPAGGRPLRILSVDDDGAVHEILRRKHGGLGFRLTSKSRAEEALTIRDLDGFDLIMVDLGLPGMSGFDFIAELKKRNFAGKIWVVSNDVDFLTAEMASRLDGLGIPAEDRHDKQILLISEGALERTLAAVFGKTGGQTQTVRRSAPLIMIPFLFEGALPTWAAALIVIFALLQSRSDEDPITHSNFALIKDSLLTHMEEQAGWVLNAYDALGQSFDEADRRRAVELKNEMRDFVKDGNAFYLEVRRTTTPKDLMDLLPRIREHNKAVTRMLKLINGLSTDKNLAWTLLVGGAMATVVLPLLLPGIDLRSIHFWGFALYAVETVVMGTIWGVYSGFAVQSVDKDGIPVNRPVKASPWTMAQNAKTELRALPVNFEKWPGFARNFLLVHEQSGLQKWGLPGDLFLHAIGPALLLYAAALSIYETLGRRALAASHDDLKVLRGVVSGYDARLARALEADEAKRIESAKAYAAMSLIFGGEIAESESGPLRMSPLTEKQATALIRFAGAKEMISYQAALARAGAKGKSRPALHKVQDLALATALLRAAGETRVSLDQVPDFVSTLFPGYDVVFQDKERLAGWARDTVERAAKSPAVPLADLSRRMEADAEKPQITAVTVAGDKPGEAQIYRVLDALVKGKPVLFAVDAERPMTAAGVAKWLRRGGVLDEDIARLKLSDERILRLADDQDYKAIYDASVKAAGLTAGVGVELVGNDRILVIGANGIVKLIYLIIGQMSIKMPPMDDEIRGLIQIQQSA